MPHYFDRERRQTALYWVRTGTNLEGQPVLGSPVELRVRWVYGYLEGMDARNEPNPIDAQALVDRRIEEGSQMWLGDLEEWYARGSSGQSESDNLLTVDRYEEVPDVKARFIQRVVSLRKKRQPM